MYSANSPTNPGKSPDGGITPSKISRLAIVRRTVSGHRKVSIAIALSMLAAVAITPYAVSASSNTSDASDPAKPSALSNQLPGEQSLSQDTTDAAAGARSHKTEIPPSNSSNTSITVNGQPVEVPANGSYDKTTSNPNGQTQVHVDSSHHQTSDTSPGSTSNQSTTSVHVNVNSQNSSESTDE